MPDNVLSDDERKLLAVEIEASKFPLSPRIVALKAIRAKLRGESPPPARAPARAITARLTRSIREDDGGVSQT
jgi:hypothetical protein